MNYFLIFCVSPWCIQRLQDERPGFLSKALREHCRAECICCQNHPSRLLICSHVSLIVTGKIVKKILIVLFISIILPFMTAALVPGQGMKDYAEKAYAEKDLDLKIRYWTLAIQQWTPEDGNRLRARLLYNRGYAYGKKGLTMKALEDLNQALELDPAFDRAYNNRGGILASLGKPARAVDDYTRAIKNNPEYAEAYYNRANARTELGQYPQAVDDYSSALKIRPDYASAYNNRGIVYSMTGDLERAMKDYNRAIEIDKNDPVYYNNRAVSHARRNDYEKALSDFSKAIAMDPYNASLYRNRGIIHHRKKEFRLAQSDYSSALKFNPSDTEARSNLKLAEKGRGFAYTEKPIRKTTEDDIKPAEKNSVDRAVALLKKGNNVGAIREFNRILEQDPNNETALLGRAHSYSGRGDYVKAGEDITRALRLSADDPVLYYNRGTLFYIRGRFKDAMKDFNRCLQLDHGYVEAYINRGSTALFLMDMERSLSDFNRALEIRPDSAVAYGNRGVVYFYTGSYDHAIEDFTRASMAEPGSELHLLNRGIVRFAMADNGGALKDFEKVLSISPGNYCARVWKIFLLSGVSVKDYAVYTDKLKKTLPKNNRKWAVQLLLFAAGSISDKTLIQRARDGSEAERKTRLTEGYFFIGLRSLTVRRHPSEASFYFKQCMEQGKRITYHYELSKLLISKKVNKPTESMQ